MASKENAILIANIGTSDIAVKIEEIKRYIPVGFDRNEPNIDDSDLTENDKSTWKQELEKSFIREYLCLELGIDKYSFRELTKRILEEYNKDEEKWHHRISLDRFQGVIDRAKSAFKIEKVYLFVTNQPQYIPDPKTGKPKFNKGYLTDTIHLYEIFHKWFKREMPDLKLEKKEIPQNISPIEQDKLFSYYYQFFRDKITKSDSIIIVSIKGGTPQMQSALRLQAIASLSKKQLFVEPILSVKRILYGEPSECKFTSYWQYMKTQKYEDIKIILDRWDFEGALQLLNQWKQSLIFLKDNNIDDAQIKTHNKLINQVINVLKIANNYWSLDIEKAKDIAKDRSSKIPPEITKQLSLNDDEDLLGDILLNTYTQCRIHYKLKQMASFLVGISSFYEIVLQRIVKDCGTEAKQKEFQEKNNRYEKREVIDSLFPQSSSNNKSWQNIRRSLNKLNLWCRRRNQFIHYDNAASNNLGGISEKSLEEFYKDEKNKGSNICPLNSILDVMKDILKSDLGLISLEQQNKFVGRDKDYYIYSEVRKWVIEQLTKKDI
ncbi:MAG: hypothetical protein F6K39_02515 [Okeania sp. SIO3B3]|nr:hypothetical protein [Okeania sp. SIO3B3]